MENLNIELLKLGLALFPGVIVTSILQFFNIKSKQYNNTKFFLYSFIYGTVIEFFYFSFFLKEKFSKEIELIKNKSLEIEKLINLITYKDVLYLIMISSLIGVFLSFLRNSGYIHKLFSKFKITYETGFETLLYSIYHSKEVEFVKASGLEVCVKFLNCKSIYYGNLVSYEDQKEYIEIFLEDAKIYLKEDSEELLRDRVERLDPSEKFYERKFLYLQLKPCEFQIEYIQTEKGQVKCECFCEKFFIFLLGCSMILNLILINKILN